MSSLKYLALAVFTICLLSCKTKKNNDISEDANYRPDQIQLDLADKMDPQRIVQSFPPFGLKVLCVVDKEMNICVFGFDNTVKTLDEMVEFLDGEVGVQGVARTLGCSPVN